MRETMVDLAQKNESHSIVCFAGDLRRVHSRNAPHDSQPIRTATQKLGVLCQSHSSGAENSQR